MVCVISLPLWASDFSEALCNDETFISFYSEITELEDDVKCLNKDELNTFRSSEEYKCQLESLATKLDYLRTAFPGIAENNFSSTVYAALKQAKQVNKIQTDPVDCEFNYMMMIWFCGDFFPCCPRPQGYNDCLDLAFEIFIGCMYGGIS